MTVLVAGLILFFLPHTLRELGLRDALASRFPSAGAFKGAYSLASLLGLGLIIRGKSMAPFIMIWEPPFELRWFSHIIMMPVFWMVLAGVGPMSWSKRKLRNPMVLGVFFWGAAHLWANGDLASMLLFGSFTLWGAVKFCTRYGAVEVPPFHIRLMLPDFVYVVLGLALYATLFIFHGDLFGVGMVVQ